MRDEMKNFGSEHLSVSRLDYLWRKTHCRSNHDQSLHWLTFCLFMYHGTLLIVGRKIYLTGCKFGGLDCWFRLWLRLQFDLHGYNVWYALLGGIPVKETFNWPIWYLFMVLQESPLLLFICTYKYLPACQCMMLCIVFSAHLCVFKLVIDSLHWSTVLLC